MIHFVHPFAFFLILFLGLSMPWLYIQNNYKDNSLLTLKQKIIGASLITIVILLILIPILYGMFSDINSFQLAEESKQLQLLGVITAFFFGIIVPIISMVMIEKEKRRKEN